jgi:hypothetical protein
MDPNNSQPINPLDINMQQPPENSNPVTVADLNQNNPNTNAPLAENIEPVQPAPQSMPTITDIPVMPEVPVVQPEAPTVQPEAQPNMVVGQQLPVEPVPSVESFEVQPQEPPIVSPPPQIDFPESAVPEVSPMTIPEPTTSIPAAMEQPQSQPVEISMNQPEKKPQVLNIILLIVAVILIVVMGYVVYVKLTSKSVSVDNSTPVVTQTQVEPTPATSDVMTTEGSSPEVTPNTTQ